MSNYIPIKQWVWLLSMPYSQLNHVSKKGMRGPWTVDHDDIIKWKHFPRYWSFVREFTGIPAQRPVTWSFDVFFNLRLNKRLRKQSRGWWFETPSCSLWRHCDVKHFTADDVTKWRKHFVVNITTQYISTLVGVISTSGSALVLCTFIFYRRDRNFF